MRIECPQCAAEYEVPESRVGAGRLLRCSRCGGQWRAEVPASTAEGEHPASPVQAPPVAAPATATPSEGAPVGAVPAEPLGAPAAEAALAAPAIEPPPPPPLRVRTPPSGGRSLFVVPPYPAPARSLPLNRLLAAAWIVSLVAIVIAVGACVVWRDDIIRAWPASARILGAAVTAGAPANT